MEYFYSYRRELATLPIIYNNFYYQQKDSAKLTQLGLSDHEVISKGKVLVKKKEIVTTALPETIVTEAAYHSKELEAALAESEVNAETYYEVYSPRLTESCEREIPIFVEALENVIPSQFPKHAEESLVSFYTLVCITSK